MPAKRPIKERFFEKVAATDGGCHLWLGTLMPNGYGQIHKDGATVYAHRVAWELANDCPIPPGGYILHSCDNRRCVNPEHLSVGTFQDNMDDMTRKRRQAHGLRNSHATLAEEQVRAIRAETGTQAAIATKYGVSQGLISMIRSGKIWRYVCEDIV